MFVGESDLFIGFGANHPGGGFGISTATPGSDAPSVVGYASNDGKQSAEFTGNYVYQEARRDEKFQVIEKIVNECLSRFKANRGRWPARVFMYRNGCSEGQFESILKYEIPLVRTAITKLCAGAKLILIVPNKLHSVRLFPAQIPSGASKPTEQNLKPGTVVDFGIAHPYFEEFYLLSHLGRLGTARVPRYSVIYNDGQVSIDEIHRLTYKLAFGHQIITGSTSLPTPGYIALEFAKRGRNILKADTTSASNGNGHNGSHNGNGSQHSTFTEISDRLSYTNVKMAKDGLPMRDYRFNA